MLGQISRRKRPVIIAGEADFQRADRLSIGTVKDKRMVGNKTGGAMLARRVSVDGGQQLLHLGRIEQGSFAIDDSLGRAAILLDEMHRFVGIAVVAESADGLERLVRPRARSIGDRLAGA